MIISLMIKGAVQGVGYRPFIASLATEYHLKGLVRNIGTAVEIRVTGNDKDLNEFVNVVKTEYPAGAFILDVEEKHIKKDPSFKYDSFVIEDSIPVSLSDDLSVFSPDIGICDDCLKEMLDIKNRRYRYPLISCASCGPRISITDRFPYDRDTTTMDAFKMCPVCEAEYKEGRRRHAQTISCHDCGPQMLLDHYELRGRNNLLSHEEKDNAVRKATEILLHGDAIGLKGISGYQLLCLPTDGSARLLRQIKGRENKPFAVMFSSIEQIKEYAHVSALEEKLLTSSSRPIVLLNKKVDFSDEVLKGSEYIGAFLPSAGIHRLICDEVGPVICTSANKSDAPMIILDDDFRKTFMPPFGDEYNSQIHVRGMLYHKREINMAQDDSVMFVIKHQDGSETSHFIRRARGFAPLPVLVKNIKNNTKILAMGGDLKSTFSFALKDKIISSQYIGDLEDYSVFENYKDVLDRYENLYEFEPEIIVRDMHPLYISHSYAEKRADMGIEKLEILDVQHHHAHALSVMAENSLDSCIGVSFDGTGYGTDGNVWGGEFLLCNRTKFERKGHLSYVKLCGGNTAPKDAALVAGCYEEALGYDGLEVAQRAALANNINTFETSSMGRLFDAVSALLNIRTFNSYEGECAVMLEKAASFFSGGSCPEICFNIEEDDGVLIADQLLLYNDIKKFLDSKEFDINQIAYAFHMAVVKLILDVCVRIRRAFGENKVCLSGGVFLNRIILRESIRVLKENSFDVYVNKLVPAGDGGISLGQAYYAMMYCDK